MKQDRQYPYKCNTK